MSSNYRPRDAWTNVPRPVDDLSRLVAADVEGFAVHWPGTSEDVIGDPGERKIAARLEGYRAYHVLPTSKGGKGFTDIAYQAAVDQAGRIWDCRGLPYRSAANGDQDVNSRFGAILLILGEKETPSSAMVQAVRQVRTQKWLDRFPHATKVVGHRDVRPEPTDCPGDRAYALVQNGSFAKPYQEEEDVPTDAQWNQLVAKVNTVAADVATLKASVTSSKGEVSIPHAVWDDDYIPNRVGSDAESNPTYAAKGVLGTLLDLAVKDSADGDGMFVAIEGLAVQLRELALAAGATPEQIEAAAARGAEHGARSALLAVNGFTLDAPTPENG